VCPAIIALCIAGAGLVPAQPVAGQEAEPVALQGAAALDQLKQAWRYNPLQAAMNPARRRTGLRNAPGKKRLNASQINQVLQGLREKTGWQSLYFDEEGFLICPDPHAFSGGSAAARRLLGEAISGDGVYDLEAHSHSLAVNFGRLASGIDYEDYRTKTKISSQLVQIDFGDFYELRGHEAARKAFDLGAVILHELAHGVWQLRDAASDEEEPGECETFINQIRRELQLPERQSYRAYVRSSRSTVSRGNQQIAELHFVHAAETQGQARQKRFLLQWEVDAVGPIASFDRATKAGRR
jgi:hypothetical protein